LTFRVGGSEKRKNVKHRRNQSEHREEKEFFSSKAIQTKIQRRNEAGRECQKEKLMKKSKGGNLSHYVETCRK